MYLDGKSGKYIVSKSFPPSTTSCSETFIFLELALLEGLSEFVGIKPDMFIDKRIERYDAMGIFEDEK